LGVFFLCWKEKVKGFLSTKGMCEGKFVEGGGKGRQFGEKLLILKFKMRIKPDQSKMK
jgi:hypothetical protein